ncbi:amino acid transporter [Neobacillus vireti]|uniref:amino acid transporter n=1 Tax=Neobacillus vireti TaxID=220686 RepID=UPI003000CAB9
MDKNKPFNDVIDHINKIEGNMAYVSKDAIKKLPKAIKLIGFFIAGFLSLTILLMIILNLLT